MIAALKIEEIAHHVPHEVAALIAALNVGAPDPLSLRQLTEKQWIDLLSFCSISHLTLPLAQLNRTGFPSWVSERLEKNLADNSKRIEHIKTVYREAATALSNAGLEHIVIKGFTQTPEYVAALGLRYQSDIDLLFPQEKIINAQTTLQNIGYISCNDIDYRRADHVPSLMRSGSWKWQGNPFDPDMPPGIELHFCLWNERVSQISIPEVHGFWERRTQRAVDGLDFPCLGKTDHVGHLSLHIFRNLLASDWIIHHVRELAVFLDSHHDEDSFWEAWKQEHSPSLRSFEAIAFYFARVWFGCAIHPLVAQEIFALTTFRKSWLNRFAGLALENMFHQKKDVVWLHLSFLSSRRARLSLLQRTFIPAHVSGINSFAVKTSNRRPRIASNTHPWLQYISYLYSRTRTYSLSNLALVLRAFRWRFASFRLLSQFLMLLTASFFFDIIGRST